MNAVVAGLDQHFSIHFGGETGTATDHFTGGGIVLFDQHINGATDPAAVACGRDGLLQRHQPVFTGDGDVVLNRVRERCGWGAVFRGEGEVTFDPPQVKTWEDTRAGANSPWAPLWRPPPVPEDGRWTVTVSFDRPGTYVLRGRGDDGALYHDQDVTIVVAPISAPE